MRSVSMLITFCGLAASTGLAIPKATAQDTVLSPTVLRVANNFAHEHATCAAYYVVASKCFTTEKDLDLRNQVASLGGEAITRGRKWTETARLKPETLTARIEMDLQRMTAQMDNSCSNISIVLAENAMACKLLLEDPKKRIETLTDDILKREAQGR